MTTMHRLVKFCIPVLLTMCAAAHGQYKPSPFGFTGVRGKKLKIDPYYESPFNRKLSPNPYYDSKLSYYGPAEAYDGSKYLARVNSLVGGSPFQKKSPYGFVGMRGKKMYPIVEGSGEKPDDKDEFMNFRNRREFEIFGYDEDRTPKTSMDLRDKKGYYGSYYKSNNNKNNNAFGDKRAPMGFVGMRGKKSYSDQKAEDALSETGVAHLDD